MSKRIIQAAVGFDKGCVAFSDSNISEWLTDVFYAKQIFRVYIEEDTPKWHAQDSALSVSSICKYKYPDKDRQIIAILSVDGIMSLAGKEEGTFEKIPCAGDKDGELGCVYRIRQIGDHLYVAGARGQVHKRIAPDRWLTCHDGLLQSSADTISEPLTINDINGRDEGDLYAVGNRGQIYWSGGDRWEVVSSPTKEVLQEICVIDDATVMICGHNGTLLKGSRAVGFEDVSPLANSENFTSLARYDDKLYLAHEKGLCTFDGASITNVRTGMLRELSDGCFLFATDGVLWSVGYHEIARLSDGKWERIGRTDTRDP